MKKSLMIMLTLMTMSNVSLVYAESNELTKTETQFEPVTSQTDESDTVTNFIEDRQEVKWGKGKNVDGIAGLTYFRDIYPMNFYERYTLDFNGERSENDKSSTNKEAYRFFEDTNKKYNYEWVKPDGSSFDYKSREGRHSYSGELNDGFNVAHIRVTGGKLSTEGKVVEVPVFQETPYFRLLSEGKDEPKYALKILKKTSNGTTFPYYSGKDFRRKEKDEINQMVQNDLIFELYDVKTHQRISENIVPVQFIETSVENEKTRGQADIKVRVGDSKYTVSNSLLIVSDQLITDFGELDEWEPVNYNDSKGVVTNPINYSRVGMPNRGIKGRLDQVNGYILRDENDYGMVFEGNPRGDRTVTIRSRSEIGLNVGIREVDKPDSMQSLYPPELKEPFPGLNWSNDFGFGGAPFLEYGDRVSEKKLETDPNIPVNSTKPNRTGNFEPYRPIVDFSVTGKYFLRKGRNLLQIQVDPVNNVTYALSNGLSRNLNFKVRNEVYNNSARDKEFSMVEFADADYYSNNVKVFTLGDHKGFKLTAPSIPENGNRTDMDLSIIIKDNNLNWMTDVNKYQVGNFYEVGYNPFGSLLDEPGKEIFDFYKQKNIALTENGATGFAIGTSWKRLSLDEKLTSGYEVFLGQEIKYLDLAIKPVEQHIYQDQFDSDKIYTDYTVGNLQGFVNRGHFEVTYPDGVIGKQTSHLVTGETEIKGKYIFDRNHFPSELNPVSGKKVTYPLKTIFVNDSIDPNDGYDEFPSEDVFYNLHVYNLGATGILQQMKTNDKFSKKPEQVVTETVYLPGHKVKYEYLVDGKVITKDNPTVEELGLDRNNENIQFVTVKMTDIEPEENGRYALVQVPFLFFKETPKDKLFIYGEDFTIEPTDMSLWRDKDIDDFLIERSRALAYDLTKTPAERLPVKVDRPNLPLNLEGGTVEEFKIIAENPDKPNEIREKKIKITVGKKIEALANNQTITLGKKESELDLKDFVKDVKSFGRDVEKKDYEVKLLEKIPDVVTQDKAIKVEVSIPGVHGAVEIIEVPITMTWGNSIAFGGDGDGVDGRMGGGAYVLHNGKNSDSPYISAVSGAVTSDDNAPVTNNSNYSGKYLQIDHFTKGKNSDNYIIKEKELNPTFTTASSGAELKQNVLDKWGTNRSRNLKHGDIIRSWSAEENKQYVSTNGKMELSGGQDEEIYYEVTKSGYRRLRFNQYKEGQAKGLITYGIESEELNQLAIEGNYIELLEKDDSIKILGFKDGSYPDVSKPSEKNETTPGTIVIREKLESGNFVDYEVVVEFTIIDGSLKFSSADKLSFGTQEVPTSDVYFAPRDKQNKVVVSDSRYEPKAWDLKATMEEPLHYNKNGKSNILKGSSILMLNPKGDKTLSKDAVVVYEISDKAAEKGENVIRWNNQLNEGYRLFVKNGTAKKGERYESTIIYSLDDKPKAKAVGDK